ncbi:MAG: pyridoxamine 5'-phosphate oxidase family protein [Prolixibacteraceae bacterium]|nr:pyridoxamine 5'-phosphate oxidase family protein [Prolixibacteraceae bacterium]MBN2772954.1 pyridoxamine 5'-phosphate oxidase family protein [Prolixibacteraceae bacterium]
MKPEKRIIDFIKEHHVLTLATSNQNIPWCANCFYAFIEDENCLVFTSDDDTKHIKEVDSNPEVAGSIVLETKIVGKIQGIQFRGTMQKPEGELAKKAKKIYLKRFPYAALMNTSLWVLHLKYIKMTDNRLGFGKKLFWEK